MNTYLYLQLILIIIFIIYIIYEYPHIFFPQELTEGFLTPKKTNNERDYKIQKSINLLPNEKFNDNIVTYIYSKKLKNYKEIFKNHNLNKKFINFYNNRKENRNKTFYQINIKDPPKITGKINVDEIIIEADKKNNLKKLYYTADNNIYCIFKQNNKFFYKYFNLDENYNKKKLVKLVGEERTDKFYKIFNIKKNGKKFLEDKDNIFIEIFETDSLNKKRGDPIGFNFFMKPLNLKLGFQKDKLTKLLKDFNCNTNGFKEWCSKKENKSKFIYWLTITRKTAKPFITFHYND